MSLLTRNIALILASNQGRIPALLELKWAKIETDPFTFFRGTAPLFYRHWTTQKVPAAPRVWGCGDAHLENIGSYRGENRIPYFDLNDFDEACLAPAHFDVGRALTSLFLAGQPKLTAPFLETYFATLAIGKPSHIQPEVAQGPIAALLKKVQSRSRESFLAERVKGNRLIIRTGHSYRLDAKTRAEAMDYYQAWAQTQTDRAFYNPADICGRIAGNGSLGLRRYMVLVKGKRLPRILDMKEAIFSAAKPYAPPQPSWTNEAERVSVTQHMLQYVPAAYLSWTKTKPVPFVIRALQPTDDRIDIQRLDRKDYHDFAMAWSRLIASSHLRTASWRKSATLDELIAFGQKITRRDRDRLLAAADENAAYHRQAFKEFKRYREALPKAK